MRTLSITRSKRNRSDLQVAKERAPGSCDKVNGAYMALLRLRSALEAVDDLHNEAIEAIAGEASANDRLGSTTEEHDPNYFYGVVDGQYVRACKTLHEVLRYVDKIHEDEKHALYLRDQEAEKKGGAA